MLLATLIILEEINYSKVCYDLFLIIQDRDLFDVVFNHTLENILHFIGNPCNECIFMHKVLCCFRNRHADKVSAIDMCIVVVKKKVPDQIPQGDNTFEPFLVIHNVNDT